MWVVQVAPRSGDTGGLSDGGGAGRSWASWSELPRVIFTRQHADFMRRPIQAPGRRGLECLETTEQERNGGRL